MKRALVLVAALAAPLVSAGETPALATPAPQIGTIEQALPPGARNVLSVFRVVKSLNARNRVYREARSVQGELRTYYDAQIVTAKQQLANREQLGLHPSQLRAYMRVLERLEGERQLVLDLTEDEKRGAKYGFESRLQRELTAALVRVPRVQEAMAQVRGVVGDLEDAVVQVQGVLETGNPISAAISTVEDRLEEVEAIAGVVEIVHGPTSGAIGSVTDRVRGLLAQAQAPLDEALENTNTVLAEINGLAVDLDTQIDTGRTVRADTAIRDAALVTATQVIFAPQSDRPDVDVMADAITRGHSRDTAEDIGRAGQVLDIGEFNSMRDRVHAALLGNTLERIADICGRIIGEARRIQLAAAESGEPVPDTSSPCGLFRNPEALQGFIDSQRTTTTVVADQPDSSVDGTTTTTTESVEDEEERTRRELIEQAAGAYEVAPALDAALSALAEQGSSTISNVSSHGVVILDSDGDVSGDLGFSYTITETFLDEPPVTIVIGVQNEFSPTAVAVDGDLLVFTASSSMTAEWNGEQYIDIEPQVTGVFDPAAGEVVVSGVFFTNEGDDIKFTRISS